MRRNLAALAATMALLAGWSLSAFAQVDPEPPMMPSYPLLRQTLAAGAGGLRTSYAEDTVYVGHSHTDHTAGGANPWNIYVGTSRPGRDPANSAIWDFDDQTGLGASAATGDSMQGWWPIRMKYRYAPLSTMTDNTRPWYLVDQGNQLNYRPINAAHPRTFGVVSAWHADPGNAAGHVMWTPISGSRSMWCGLRELNDNSVIDPVTHQPYNEQVTQFSYDGSSTAPGPTYRCYPGYGNQWDQLLYRDFAVSDGAPMTVSFLYRTRMSTAFSTGVTTRTGWFHGDPLAMTAGNFISANAAGANAPRDSFSVYIGVPVNDSACVFSDATVSPAPVWDRQRRWFNEVLRADAPRFEILGQAGANPADTLLGAASASMNIPWADPGNGNAYVSAIADDPHNPAKLVRLVFRVKTNRTFSDDDYKSGNGIVNGNFTSSGRGAVLLDDVVVNGVTSGFEGADGGVDNALDSAGEWVSPPTATWKATGKPLPTYVHPVDLLAETHWSDICGPPHSPASACNLDGIVLAVGNADQDGSIADARWPAFTEGIFGFVSPTIDLKTSGSGPNEMGITAAMAAATDDIYVQYEVNDAAFVLVNTGTLWTLCCQAYPALTANGHNTWSDLAIYPGRYYDSGPRCLRDLIPLKSTSMVHTSNPNGIPDSIRVSVEVTTECFYFGGVCNSNPGGYFDDISIVLVNKSGTSPGALSSDIWQWFNDAFPVNGLVADNVSAGTPAFDTTTAYVKGALNLAPTTGDASRWDVLADSIVVSAPNPADWSAGTRVDLVFRILPGPGNFRNKTGRTFPPTAPPSAGGDAVTGMELLQVPSDPATVATPGDGSFWGQYMLTPGQFASPGAHHGGTWWDYLSWNSARCDTVETNLFPVSSVSVGYMDPAGPIFQSTYHESDPHFATLGIQKGRCFTVLPNTPLYSTTVSCDPTWNSANLAWPNGAGTGFNGSWTTREFTKIIPDGLLTPGSHVQYFFRKSSADGSGTFVLEPDTTNISPQIAEGDFDGHRWQHFGVLPDRWKDPLYGGSGAACMLYIDNGVRLGDQRAWVSVMDSLGMTQPAKWGANDGWHARGAGFGLYNQDNPDIAQAYVHGRNQQPGTSWDMYGVRAGDYGQLSGAQIGNRYAPQPPGPLGGRAAAIGPRKEWLRTYYRGIAWLTGPETYGAFGPAVNMGQDDIGVIEDFLATPAGSPQPRSLLVQGSDFAQQCVANAGTQLDFLGNFLFAGLRSPSYSDLTPTLQACSDLIADPSIVPDGTVFSVAARGCAVAADVLTTSTSEGAVAVQYQPTGPNAPYVAGVEHVATVAHNWHSMLLGWDMQDTYSRQCATTNGRLAFYSDLLTELFGPVGCAPPPGSSVGVDPPARADVAVDFMRVAGGVITNGTALIRYGAAQPGHVRIQLYDVSGRRIRTLVDRVVATGAYDVRWDGRGDGGSAVRPGVYFARMDGADGVRIGGRMIVLR